MPNLLFRDAGRLNITAMELSGVSRVSVRLSTSGDTLALSSQGDGDAILFIHGFPLDRTMWQSQLTSSSGWRRLAPDLRGFGNSEAKPVGDRWSIGSHADDLAALLDEMEIDRAVVCGLSMGGYVAFELW